MYSGNFGSGIIYLSRAFVCHLPLVNRMLLVSCCSNHFEIRPESWWSRAGAFPVWASLWIHGLVRSTSIGTMIQQDHTKANKGQSNGPWTLVPPLVQQRSKCASLHAAGKRSTPWSYILAISRGRWLDAWQQETNGPPDKSNLTNGMCHWCSKHHVVDVRSTMDHFFVWCRMNSTFSMFSCLASSSNICPMCPDCNGIDLLQVGTDPREWTKLFHFWLEPQ